MHIGFFVPAWPPGSHANGIVTYISVLKPALERRGVKVSIVSALTWANEFHAAIALEPIWRKALFRASSKLIHYRHSTNNPVAQASFELGIYIEQLNRLNKFDVFEIEETLGLASGVVSRLSGRVVIRIHGPHMVADQFSLVSNSKDARRRIAAESHAIKTANAVSCPSKVLLDTFSSDYRMSPDLRAHILNPMSFTLQDDIGSGVNPYEILFVGRFDRPKGADICIAAFELALRKCPLLTLTIVGPDHGVEVTAGNVFQFKEYAERFIPVSVRCKISFMGKRSSSEVNQLRNRAAMCIVASRYEVFSYSIVEAMALAKPIIATETIGARELIRDGLTGQLVCNEDSEELANAIVRYAQDPSFAKQMGDNARAWSYQHLNADVIADQMLSFYEKVAAV